MNYRTMVKGALAFSLSLIVGSASAAVSTNSVPQYGVTFENAVSTAAPLNDRPYVADTLIGTNNTTEAGDSYGWFSGSEEDESKIIAANGGQALQLNTDSATLTNKLASADKTAINNAIAADGAFFETEIKFVASDSPDAGIEGGKDATKFAIYAYCDEEANPCTTNLVVYHAYQDYEDESLSENNFIGYTNEVFATLIDTEVYTKLRIEMRQIDDNGTQRNLFSVSVNGGDPIASTEGLAYEDGIWFLTVENSLSDAAREVSSLNFKGTGEIDNINVGVIQIETTSATVIFVAEDGTTPLYNQTLEVGAIPAYAGAASGTNNTATAEGIKTFTGWTCGEDFYAVGEALPAAVNGETTYVATFSTVPAVASVNGAYYASLADAVAAAIAAGGADPVVLNGNVALDDWILVDGAVTIDLAGYTISKGANWIVATPAHDALVAVVHGGSLTVNDSSDPSTGMIDGSTLPCGIKMTIAGDTDDTNPATLVVNGGTIKGQNYAIAGNGLAGRGNTAITINGGVILGTDPTGDSCGIFHPQAGTLTINGGRIEGGQGVWMKSGTCVCTVTAGEIVGTAPLAAYVTSKNGFNSTGDAFVVDNVGYPGGAPAPSILGGTFVSSNANAVASYSNAANEPIGGFVAGGTFSTPVPADYCAEGYEPDSWEEEGVTYYGVKPTSPATVITIALVNGATYTDAEGVLTFAAPEGYVVNSIYTNGVNTGFTTTFTTNGLTGTINIVAAAKKVRPAVAHKWYENPGVIATNFVGASGNAGPYRFAIGSDLAAISYGNHRDATTGIKLFTVDSLVAGNASPIYNEIVGDADSLNIPSVRGAAISEALDVALVTAYNGTKVYSLPLSTNELELGVNAFEITNDQGITFDRAYFTSDNQYLYTSWCIEGSNDKIAKWAIADGLKGSGQKLTLEAQYTMPSRVRDFAYARINGKDLFYVLQNGTAGVCVYDVSGGTNAQLTAMFAASGNYGSVAVSMTSTSTPTLTVMPSTSDGTSTADPMVVYQLAADGLSIVDTLATFTKANLMAIGIPATTDKQYIRTAIPSEDDGTLYLGYGNSNLYVLQYVEPVYDVTVTVEGGTISTGIDAVPTGTTLHVAAGTEIVFTAATGNTLSSVTTNNLAVAGIDTTATAYTYTVGDSDATVAVVFAAPAPAATVISVAKLSATGAMVNDAAPALTATVTDENGDAVAAADYTIDASAIDMTTAGLYPVIITATGAGYAGTLTNYYAVMNLTWFNGTPTQKAMLTNAYVGVIESQSEGSHWMSKSENDRYLAINHSSSNNDSRDAKMVSLYELATLTNLYGLCYSKWEFALGKAKGSKGVAVSEAAGLVTLGNPKSSPTVNPTYAVANISDQDLGANLQYAFIKNGASVQQKHDSPSFSTDGEFLYVNTYGGNVISKYSVDKVNNQFVWVQDYVGSVTRIRSLEVYAIGGRDYVFYGEGGGDLTGNIYAMDTVTGESALVCSARESAAFDNESGDGRNEVQLVRISGIASGEMYLYAHSDHGVIVIWALRHDATTGAWKTALVREFTQAEYLALCDRESLSNSRNLEVSDDNQYGFILPHYTADARLIVVTDISLAQRKALASATLTPAGSDKDVALGAITATVLDENGATVAASEYTITTNLIDIATVGEYTVTITPVEGSVYSNAVTAVYTISEPAAGYNYPEGGAIEDAAVVAWLTAKGFTQAQVTALGTNAKLNECYLLNCDISKAGAGGSIAITGITVDAQGVHVTVALTRTAGIAGGINGTLKLYGADDLADEFEELDAATVTDDDFSEGDTTTATLSGGTAKFFRAVVE